MVGSPLNILSYTREGRWCLVYQGLSQELITSLAELKAIDASLESSQAICKHPSKARMPQHCTGEEGRDPPASREPGWVGCSGVLLLWCSPGTHHHGSQRCRMMILSLLPFPFLDSLWARGNHKNVPCLPLGNTCLAVTLPSGQVQAHLNGMFLSYP